MKINNEKRVKPKKLDPSFFYEEEGKIVFTEKFHINRGYCCGNNCRHCPYQPKAQKGNTTIKK